MGCIFPPRCPVCGGLRIPWESSTCPDCAGVLRRIAGPVCFRCGKEIGDETREYCDACKETSSSMERNFAVWHYDKAMKRSIAGFKYEGRKEYADFYVRHMAGEQGRYLSHYGVTALIPVPISLKRSRYRGFNQAELLADKLAKELGMECVPLLKRVKNTLPQSSLSGTERKKNLIGAVRMDEEVLKRIKHLPEAVAIVDDIYTTGSTMSVCADVLKAGGISRVYGVCVCIGSD